MHVKMARAVVPTRAVELPRAHCSVFGVAAQLPSALRSVG